MDAGYGDRRGAAHRAARHEGEGVAPRGRPAAGGRRPAFPVRGPVPARIQRRAETENRDRQGAGSRAAARGRGRAGLGPGRVGAGSDPEPADRSSGPVRAELSVHRARPERGAVHQRSGRRHVPGQDRGDRRSGRRVPPPPPSVYGSAAVGASGDGSHGGGGPHRPARRRAESGQSAAGMSVPPALPVRRGSLQGRSPGAG